LILSLFFTGGYAPYLAQTDRRFGSMLGRQRRRFAHLWRPFVPLLKNIDTKNGQKNFFAYLNTQTPVDFWVFAYLNTQTPTLCVFKYANGLKTLELATGRIVILQFVLAIARHQLNQAFGRDPLPIRQRRQSQQVAEIDQPAGVAHL